MEIHEGEGVKIDAHQSKERLMIESIMNLKQVKIPGEVHNDPS